MVSAWGFRLVSDLVGISILVSMALTVCALIWPLRWPLLLSGVLSLFFCTAEAPSIGLLLLPIPFLQFAFGVSRFVHAPRTLRVALSGMLGAVFVVVGLRVFGHLLT